MKRAEEQENKDREGLGKKVPEIPERPKRMARSRGKEARLL